MTLHVQKNIENMGAQGRITKQVDKDFKINDLRTFVTSEIVNDQKGPVIVGTVDQDKFIKEIMYKMLLVQQAGYFNAKIMEMFDSTV